MPYDGDESDAGNVDPQHTLDALSAFSSAAALPHTNDPDGSDRGSGYSATPAAVDSPTPHDAADTALRSPLDTVEVLTHFPQGNHNNIPSETIGRIDCDDASTVSGLTSAMNGTIDIGTSEEQGTVSNDSPLPDFKAQVNNRSFVEVVGVSRDRNPDGTAASIDGSADQTNRWTASDNGSHRYQCSPPVMSSLSSLRVSIDDVSSTASRSAPAVPAYTSEFLRITIPVVDAVLVPAEQLAAEEATATAGSSSRSPSGGGTSSHNDEADAGSTARVGAASTQMRQQLDHGDDDGSNRSTESATDTGEHGNRRYATMERRTQQSQSSKSSDAAVVTRRQSSSSPSSTPPATERQFWIKVIAVASILNSLLAGGIVVGGFCAAGKCTDTSSQNSDPDGYGVNKLGGRAASTAPVPYPTSATSTSPSRLPPTLHDSSSGMPTSAPSRRFHGGGKGGSTRPTWSPQPSRSPLPTLPLVPTVLPMMTILPTTDVPTLEERGTPRPSRSALPSIFYPAIGEQGDDIAHTDEPPATAPTNTRHPSMSPAIQATQQVDTTLGPTGDPVTRTGTSNRSFSLPLQVWLPIVLGTETMFGLGLWLWLRRRKRQKITLLAMTGCRMDDTVPPDPSNGSTLECERLCKSAV